MPTKHNTCRVKIIMFFLKEKVNLPQCILAQVSRRLTSYKDTTHKGHSSMAEWYGTVKLKP